MTDKNECPAPSPQARINPTRVARQHAWRVCGLAALTVWAFAVGIVIERVWAYSATPGAAAAGPAAWPGSKLIKPHAQQPTLVMFVHPQCPCSRASVEELRVAMERARRPMSVWVLFLRPEGTDEAWENTPLWRSAASIPGVQVATDRDGSEAARFGASTSGHTVLYGADGHFLFSGGITGSRGHLGDNAGLQRVLDMLDGKTFAQNEFPVFGCSLISKGERQ